MKVVPALFFFMVLLRKYYLIHRKYLSGRLKPKAVATPVIVRTDYLFVPLLSPRSLSSIAIARLRTFCCFS